MDRVIPAFISGDADIVAFLSETREQLQTRAFAPLPVRERLIPKSGKSGQFRRLGIPSAMDRLVQAVAPRSIHADRGTSMTSDTVTGLLALLGIDQSHFRPHVSNDNPYSEAQFKTLKYCPAFPGRFGSIEDANVFCGQFFRYYNHEHRHSGIAMHTPASVHDGTAVHVQARRIATLHAAFQAHPERFRGRRPFPPPLPTKVWINQPSTASSEPGTSPQSTRVA
ncbi:hypothetical protein E1294_46095 [Nonomuraea diastatica]|uniref:Integrase catalytic domain-containing protein n=1 Tax=Nonomuraea diastatica TaxID=1848329 RepID=A0A4R4VYB6_9ACTN|nr:hypothetical protein E1294_46095 [Nonomuraea diastatica]